MKFKEPLIFLGGLVAGGAIGVAAMWRRCDARVNKAYEESREYYNSKLTDLSAKNRNKPEPSEIINKSDDLTAINDNSKVVQKNPEKTDYTEYATVTKEDPEDPVVSEEEENGIEPISDEDYMYDHDYDKMTVIIYSDGVLARDDNDDILEIDDTIGADAYNAAYNNPNPYDAIYVRNKARSIDYEVVTNDKTYTEQTGVFLDGETRE